MRQVAHTLDRRRGRQLRLIIILLASLSLIGTPWYSTAKLQPPLMSHLSPTGQDSIASESPAVAFALGGERQAPRAPAATLAPFLDILPSSDGTGLYVSAGGVGELGGTVFVTIGIGPGHDKGSYTMTYSDTAQAYVTTVTGFTPNTGAAGPINITTTLGLDTGAVEYYRAYVPPATPQTISSIDGRLRLSLVSPDTFPGAAYIVVVPSYAPPGPAPTGHRFVGSSYSVRASGALATADRPLLLELAYDATTLAGADPHTLAIFAWDAFQRHWDRLGGRLDSEHRMVSVATSRFTTYALMATTTWRDDFDDFDGLDLAQTHNVTLTPQGDSLALGLASAPGSGFAVSRPITLTDPLARWDTLLFASSASPPTTILTVDVLSADGTPLLTNVARGARLNGIDPAAHPALRLRANLASTVTGQTSVLDAWEMTWEIEQRRVYMPLVSNNRR